MTIPYREMDELLEEEDFSKVWKRLLRTSIQTHRDTLIDEEWREISPYETDILSSLSYTEIGILYEYGLASSSWENRKANGQYFTPDDVSEFMASMIPDELNTKSWVDPCCGVGNLSYALGKRFSNPQLFLKNLTLVDKDPLATLTSSVLLSLYVGDGDYDVYHQLMRNAINSDFLDVEGQWDYSILNPPYVSGVSKENYDTSDCGDLYAFFMEKIIKTVQGYVAVIPQTWMNSPKFSPLKNLIMREGQHIKVFSFDNMPDSLFKGVKFGSQNTNKKNSTRGSIISSFPADSLVEVSPMMRWRAGERHKLFDALPAFLSPISHPVGLVPKVYPGLVGTYEDLESRSYRMRDIVDPRGDMKLIVPSSPRYFISASTVPLERNSMKILSFSDEISYYKALLMINSRIMYYWWKVRDNGMSLSKEVLLDLPVPENYVPSSDLVERLIRGQNTHRVSKLNAGKLNENIKHSEALVDDITREMLSALEIEADIGLLKETANSSYITSCC